eukprot:gnl/TRDRNA2_/TRDRNA2_184279_c0_seq1.p1 gnl/TRDRNA2_/TRDRNA2_184279_c0~~gnl/TRDRNA2_/TRDRNA2_184279_c0_seq1.p1  ORF type:complete len:303 (+),score=64.31 gnl/TRDRNA2_/TRDRNA2_184279_c0_seq1:150-1058(+)
MPQQGSYGAEMDDPSQPLMQGQASNWPQPNAKGKPRRSRTMDVLISIALPFLIFFLITCLFLFGYHDLRVLCWVIIGACVVLALLFACIGTVNRHPVFLALGFLCLAACIVGVTIGLFLDCQYLDRFYQLDRGVEYKGVDATMSASYTGDAAIVTYKNDTFVDDWRTIGYIDEGNVYCVAPVVKPGKYYATVEYWASGINCCEKRRNFDCGEARNGGDMLAIVQKDEDDLKAFRKAIKEAESVYGVKAGNGTQIVFFVNDVQEVLNNIWNEAAMVAFAACVVHLCVSAFAGLMVGKALPATV